MPSDLSDHYRQESYWSDIRLPNALQDYRRERARSVDHARYHKRQVRHVIAQIRAYRALIASR